jgi:hypothetical protein
MSVENATHLYRKLFANVPHPRGSCHDLRMFVYDLPEYVVAGTLRNAERLVNLNCLMGKCKHSFGNSLYTYTGELFVLRRLLAQCERVSRPDAADFFLVPFPLSLWRVVGWSAGRSVRDIKAALTPHLLHMTDFNAHMHVFLDTNDSVFLMDFEKLPRFSRAIVVHLGPDLWSGHMRNAWTVVRKQEFKNSIIVPYRTHVIGDCRHTKQTRNVTVFGALNPNRHPIRSALIRHFAAQNGPDVHVKPMSDFVDIEETVRWTQRSKYCLAPAGDTPSVTQRFPAAVACGCVPVYVDPYKRIGGLNDSVPVLQATLPFHRSTDWRRAAVRVSAVDGLPGEGVLPAAGHSHEWRISRALSRRMQYDLKTSDDASQGALDELRLALSFGTARWG